jgi:2-(1,2-epoxy-1,2-dihydrophenyl)acetyl-CoA isomerase
MPAAAELAVPCARPRQHRRAGAIGLVPEVGLGWLLTRRLGYHKTMELFITGTVLSAEDALALGLVNSVVPHDQLLSHAQNWCEQAIAVPAHALDMTKPLLRNIADMSWDQAIAVEEFAEPMCFTTRAHRDAVNTMLKGQAHNHVDKPRKVTRWHI